MLQHCRTVLPKTGSSFRPSRRKTWHQENWNKEKMKEGIFHLQSHCLKHPWKETSHSRAIVQRSLLQRRIIQHIYSKFHLSPSKWTNPGVKTPEGLYNDAKGQVGTLPGLASEVQEGFINEKNLERKQRARNVWCCWRGLKGTPKQWRYLRSLAWTCYSSTNTEPIENNGKEGREVCCHIGPLRNTPRHNGIWFSVMHGAGFPLFPKWKLRSLDTRQQVQSLWTRGAQERQPPVWGRSSSGCLAWVVSLVL